MKACPTCKRTYADETLTFCLVDGSILSAPYDPHETLQIPAARDTEPAPTEILNPAPVPSNVGPTPLSTIHAPQPPPLYPAKQQAPLNENQSGKPWMAIGLVTTLLLVLAVGGILSFIWFGQDSESVAKVENTNTKEDDTNTNVANTNATPTVTPTMTPTATPSAPPSATPTPMPSATPTAKPTATVRAKVWGQRTQASINEGERITYYPGSTPERCQADCDANPRCIAYTLIKAGFYNPSDPPMCYLMAAVYTVNPSPCCITAIKR